MDFRLDDDEILAFIARGYHILQPDIDAQIHRELCAQTGAEDALRRLKNARY